MFQRGSVGRISVKFNLADFYEILSRKHIWLNRSKISDTLHEDQVYCVVAGDIKSPTLRERTTVLRYTYIACLVMSATLSLFNHANSQRSRGSVVGISARLQVWWQRDHASIPVRGKRVFCGPALGPTQPPIQWTSRAFSPRVKRPGPESDQ
jgi:hypothetical protein